FEETEPEPAPDEVPLPPGARGIAAPVPGSIWQVLVQAGDAIRAGDVIMIIESMKMEVQVRCSASGTIQHIIGTKGQVVRAGQRLGVIAA
ncbi:MAG TPA: acetyl-CoA carboxylase biotin carboxyl carrier protein subunit, partial [Acidocella sp.]|nr:acetyl-CoA carboxylase biotin carboxyl carrier protein subunit [Acidocella sp.]